MPVGKTESADNSLRSCS